MASTQISSIPSGSIVRTPQHSLLVLKDGSLRTLRDGDKTWSKRGVRQELPSWASLDDFLAAANPTWWTIDFKYPVGWFTEEIHKQYRERCAALPRGEGYLHASQKVWDETFGVRRQAFLDEIVLPICTKYGLTRAADYNPNEVLFGTAGSPVARTAAEQLFELEPDRTKWADRMWETSGSQHEQFHRHFCALYYRNQSYERRKQAAEAKRLLEKKAAPVVPPLLMPSPPALPLLIAPARVIETPAAAPLAPRAPAENVQISRQQLDLILATGIKKVPDQLWEQLSAC